ncbi:MAG: alpha/beta hydrolase [Alphaproteobacteria bacterium]|nr:alpha/beta hydrolase [Alphaproteobacteria bacterium]
MFLDLYPCFYFSLNDHARLRYSQLTPSSPSKGTILVVPGARECIEKKMIEVGKPLFDRGFRVIIVEPRGQGLSSRFFKDGPFRQRDHVADFVSHLDDLRQFFEGVVRPATTGPLFVHGHSLGGHILLRWLAEDRPDVAGAFLTAPMVALSGMAAYMAGYGVSWTCVHLLGMETRYAPMQHDFGGDDLIFQNNPLTSDEDRFHFQERLFDAHPSLKTGGVTWGWLLAAVRSMNTMHTWPYLARIDHPVLTLTGDQDPITPPAEIAPFLNMIPRVYADVISGARHDVLNETEPLRRQAWERIDAFLDGVMAEASRPQPNSCWHRAAS